MAKFISRYRSHRLKGPGGVIKFEGNQCVLENQEQIDFLRNHSDYGVVIFEEKQQVAQKIDERQKQQKLENEFICPYCNGVYKSQQGLAAHMRSCKKAEPEDEE